MRRSSGTRSTSPFKVDPGNALSCVAAALVASFLPSPAFAASDDVNDTVVVDEESAGGTAPSASLPSKGAASAPGGLTIEGLAYWRSGLKKVPFTALGEPTSSQPTPTGYVKFDSSDLEGDDYAPGMRVSLHATMLDQPIELSGFFVAPFRFEQTKLELSSGSINTDTIYDNAPGSDYPNTANSDNIYGLAIHHETKLFGAEANAVRPFGIPGLSVGARAIYFGETLSSTAMSTSGSATNPPPTGTAIGEPRDRATIRTDNRLVGLQLGLQHMFDVGDVMRIGGSIKGGLYNNFVDRNRTFASENRIDIRSFETTDHKNVFAQGVEINPRVEFKLAEGTYLTASGQFLWLNNVSTALPHYATVNASGDHDVRANDDVFFYGGSLGLTVLLDQSSPTSNSLAPFPPVTSSAPAVDPSELDERIAELEDTTARKGNNKVSLSVSGWINRMALFWDDGGTRDVYVVDNVASRSRINFDGAAQFARGWSAGYLLSIGLDDTASNDVNQFTSIGDEALELRHSAWWIRSNELGTVTLGHTSTATDNIILKDVGGIMPGAANIATIGGSFVVRRADRYDPADSALITNDARTVDTTLNDFSAGASVDTLRRDVIRYDAPRFSGQWGNVDLSVAWGEDDFYRRRDRAQHQLQRLEVPLRRRLSARHHRGSHCRRPSRVLPRSRGVQGLGQHSTYSDRIVRHRCLRAPDVPRS